jgi:dTDP-L-rhamnose 4-epimerase
MNKNLLVIGGAGFIGSHTCDIFYNAGYQVTILDNLNPKTHDNDWPTYLNKNFIKIKGDLCDKDLLLSLLKKNSIILNFAAEMDLNPDFYNFFQTNVSGTSLIYELIIKHNLKISKILIASTQFIYGDGNWECEIHGKFNAECRQIENLRKSNWDIKCPVCNSVCLYIENVETISNPSNHYSLSKYFQEQLAIKLGKLYKIPTVALRYSIVHGSRQSLKNTYSGLLRNFAISIDNNIELDTFEDNMMLRDYVSVLDVASANLMAIESTSTDYEIYNVGGGVGYTPKDIAELLSIELKKPFLFKKNCEFRTGDIKHAISNISKLEEIGWKPLRSEKDNIKEYLNWFKDQKIDLNAYLKQKKISRTIGIINKVM